MAVEADATALRALGNRALAAGRLAEAARAYERAVSMGQDAHLALSNLSALRLREGKPQEALELARKCRQAAPRGFPKAHVRAALALAALGDRAAAEKELAAAEEDCETQEQRAQLRKVKLPPGPVDEEAAALRAAKAEMEALQAAVDAAERSKKAAAARVESARKAVRPEEVEHLEATAASMRRATEALQEQMRNVSLDPAPTPAAEAAQQGSPSAPAGPPSERHNVVLRVAADADTGELRVQWEWMGPRHELGPEHAEDFLGLYLADETDPDEYWNQEADVAQQGRQGAASMRKPTRDGVYQFRYITERGKRCAGRSAAVIVRGRTVHIGRLEPPRFLLLKEPNLLVYWLYLPLDLPPDKARVDISGTSLPALRMTAEPDARVPTMALSKDKRTVEILAPVKSPLMRGAAGSRCPAAGAEAAEYHLIPLVEVALDDEVDLDRSTLSLHGGDFLAARLAISNHSATAVARRQRQAQHPAPKELDRRSFSDGLECAACAAPLARGVPRVLQAPSTPWSELLEHLTCIPPEAYRGGETHSAFSAGVVGEPEEGAFVLAEAHVDVAASDLKGCALRLCRELGSLRLDPDNGALSEHEVDRPAECAACGAWVGLLAESGPAPAGALSLDETQGTGGLDLGSEALAGRVRKARLFKTAVRPVAARDLFAAYDATGTLVGSQLQRLVEVRECRTVVVACGACGELALELTLWGTDSWLRTAAATRLEPVLKVTFQEMAGGQPASIVLRQAQFERLRADLAASNAMLPPSARILQGSSIGFLRW